jgi:aminoglycoside phosphotransferase (APT) family kinase protein
MDVEELELLASGREADVYLLDDDRVLRRYRDGSEVADEVLFMSHLRVHDYPVPEVFRAEGSDLEMARLTGQTMLDSWLANDFDERSMAEMLADLLWRLHSIPALSTGDPAVRVLHLDLHPANVMMTPDGPVVIDWRNATDGDPAFDLAMTALILAQAGLTMEEPVAEGALATMYAFRERIGRRLLAGLPAAARRRASNPTMSEYEQSRLDDAVALVSGRR